MPLCPFSIQDILQQSKLPDREGAGYKSLMVTAKTPRLSILENFKHSLVCQSRQLQEFLQRFGRYPGHENALSLACVGTELAGNQQDLSRAPPLCTKLGYRVATDACFLDYCSQEFTNSRCPKEHTSHLEPLTRFVLTQTPAPIGSGALRYRGNYCRL